MRLGPQPGPPFNNYQNSETILFGIYPYYGDLKKFQTSLTATQKLFKTLLVDTRFQTKVVSILESNVGTEHLPLSQALQLEAAAASVVWKLYPLSQHPLQRASARTTLG